MEGKSNSKGMSDESRTSYKISKQCLKVIGLEIPSNLSILLLCFKCEKNLKLPKRYCIGTEGVILSRSKG